MQLTAMRFAQRKSRALTHKLIPDPRSGSLRDASPNGVVVACADRDSADCRSKYLTASRFAQHTSRAFAPCALFRAWYNRSVQSDEHAIAFESLLDQRTLLALV
jgi:hypothetical protein